MGYIYKITNDINNQVYIGLTTRSIEQRWKEHIRHKSSSIDNAIQKYGIAHFSVEEIEECPDEIIDEREIYWIEYYDSFNNGYNATFGGRDGSSLNTLKVQEVLKLWEQGLTVNKIVEETKLNVETIRNYLNKNGITHDLIRQRANIYIGKSKAKTILQFDINNNFLKEWESTAEATRNGYSKASIQRSLSDGKPHAGYIWKRKDD